MLSETAIKKLEPRACAYRVFDTCGIPGFGVQVTPAGNRGYFLRYREDGKSRYLSLGHHPHTPLSAAREKARQARARLDQGLPLVDAPAPAATLEALLRAWLEHQRANDRRGLDTIERMIRGNVPPDTLSLPARSVTPEHIRAALAIIHQRGARVRANRVRAHLHAMFAYGLKADHDPRRMSDPTLFGVTVNPVAAIPRDAGAEQARDRVLSWPEIRALWSDEELPWAARQACRLLLLTGQRVNEVCQAAWVEFDIEAGLWTLPAARSKNHRTHLVPLSPPVVDLLNELREVYPGDWLFPYRNMARAAKPWGATALAHAVLRWQNAQQTRNKRAENAQKLPDMATGCANSREILGSSQSSSQGLLDRWRPQDLRRTMKTWAVAAGIERGILDRVQNHNRSDVASRHYDRHDYLTEKRAALNQWAAELMARLAGDNVVSFKTKSAG